MYVHTVGHAHICSAQSQQVGDCSVERRSRPHCSEEVWRREGCTLTGLLTGSSGLTAIGTH